MSFKGRDLLSDGGKVVPTVSGGGRSAGGFLFVWASLWFSYLPETPRVRWQTWTPDRLLRKAAKNWCLGAYRFFQGIQNYVRKKFALQRTVEPLPSFCVVMGCLLNMGQGKGCLVAQMPPAEQPCLTLCLGERSMRHDSEPRRRRTRLRCL